MSKNTLLSELINYVSANSSGNVTVAAPASGLALDVNGTGRFTGALTLGAIENISITNAGQTTFLKLTNLNGGLGDTANIDFSISGGGTTMSRISSVRDTIASVADISLAFSTFNVSLTEKMRILGNGNVGIGTSSPIGGAGASDRTLSINSGAGAASFVTGMVNGTRFSTLFTSSSSVVLETNAAIPLAFNTNGTERMRITSGGNVGIGTTSIANPEGFQRVLNVSSNNAALVLSNTNGTTKNWSLGAYEDGSFRIVDANSERIRVTGLGQIEFKGVSTNSLASAVFENGNSNFAIYATMGGGTTKDLFFASGGSGGAPNMTFKAGGNLLIATTSDVGGKLQVNGDIRAYGSFFRETGNITVNNSWTNVFTINTASQRTYLLQIIATNSEASLSYRYFGVIQGNPASSSYTAVSLASQTMEVQFSGATIQTRLTNSNQFNFNWSITQLL